MTLTEHITVSTAPSVAGTAKASLVNLDAVRRPAHYQGQFDHLLARRSIEAIDIIEAIVAQYEDPVLAGLVWQQLKYLIRAPKKGKLAEDIAKNDWYGRRAANRAATLP
jgi:hypothetical protein